MNEAATVWIAPFWYNLPHPDTLAVRAAQLWVLNPGATKAQVTARFFEAVTGNLVNQEAKTLDPKTSGIFGPDADNLNAGWCRINSDEPVVPWGLTAFETGNDTGYLNMTFYRFETPRIKLPLPKGLRRP